MGTVQQIMIHESKSISRLQTDMIGQELIANCFQICQ